MSEKTKIAWTDSTESMPKPFTTFQSAKVARAIGFEVDSVMARFAKRESIGNHETKIMEIGKWFNVVCSEISTVSIATFLTGEGVTGEYCQAPIFVTRITAGIQEALLCTILPCVVILSAWIMLATIFTHFTLRFFRELLAKAATLTFKRSRQLSFGFCGVMMSFERRWSSFPIHTNFNSATSKARRINSITTSFIFAKILNRFPSLTTCATFLTRLNQRFELLKSKASILSRELHCSDFCLCHS